MNINLFIDGDLQILFFKSLLHTKSYKEIEENKTRVRINLHAISYRQRWFLLRDEKFSKTSDSWLMANNSLMTVMNHMIIGAVDDS